MIPNVKISGRISSFIIYSIFFLISSQTSAQSAKGKATAGTKSVHIIKNIDELNTILESSGDKLLLFDLYADWCAPCKILSPMLEEIAKENKDKVTVYKINIDKNPGIASALNVTGIPFVILVKNKQVVNAFTGVQPRDTYVRAINMHSQKDIEKTSFTPDGTIINGIREIRLSTATSPNKIYVYRGETVKLIIEKVEFPYSIHIPEYKISKDGIVGKDLSVTFKAKEIGVFPIFCNGKCPTGDGASYGQIVVMQYESKGDAKFTELTVKDAEKLIKNSKPLILDVRTPNEFYKGHLPNAKLIPLQQLEQRLSEIEDYKNKAILVYCRSGNRSTVASEILISKGFKKLHNLRKGIIGWKKEGKAVVK